MPRLTIEPRSGWQTLDLSELFAYRELLFFLAWRDVKVRYKQTALGALWAILRPLVLMVVFSIVFGRVAGVSSEGVPYPIFSLAALVPWTLFAQALADASVSLVASSNLVTKIYFPRLVIPIASVGSHLVDLVIGLLLLIGVMPFYGIEYTARLLALPFLLIFLVAAALSFGIGLSALNVRYRDVRYAVPFLVQVLLLASPVAYSSLEFNDAVRRVYAINPMVGVLDGFRWSLLGLDNDPAAVVAVSVMSTVALLAGGCYYFKRVETSFADEI